MDQAALENERKVETDQVVADQFVRLAIEVFHELEKPEHGRTGSWARRSASSICRPAPRSPARASRSSAALGARLVRALADFMLDLHTREHGYLEVAPPYLVNRATLTGTGQLPKFEEELYASPADDLFLIPTAEVPVTNIHRDEILEARTLPRRPTWPAPPASAARPAPTGRTPAGSSGCTSSTRWSWCASCGPRTRPPSTSGSPGTPRAVLRRLELPYRVVELAAGDTGFASARTYDLEVWAAGVGTWLEVSSSSTFTDFQARRANIRFRPAPKAKPEFVHTLNASGVAFPRTIIALLENNQAADGSVRVPAALVPYLGVDRLAPRA